MVQKLITLVTLREYFLLKFFDGGMMTSTHMVSYHETSKENRPIKDEERAPGVKSRKTKEDDKVVANP